jgi:hypothetical protein
MCISLRVMSCMEGVKKLAANAKTESWRGEGGPCMAASMLYLSKDIAEWPGTGNSRQGGGEEER